MSVSVPTIDFGAFEGRDPEAHARVVRQVADACERVGFFFASNHGIKITHYLWVWRWACHGANNVKRGFDIGDPIPHRFAERVL